MIRLPVTCILLDRSASMIIRCRRGWRKSGATPLKRLRNLHKDALDGREFTVDVRHRTRWQWRSSRRRMIKGSSGYVPNERISAQARSGYHTVTVRIPKEAVLQSAAVAQR